MSVATSSSQLAYLGDVEDHMRRMVGEYGGSTALAAMEPVMAGGKRLRPLLVRAAMPEHAEPASDAIAAGASVELLHTASLVHDDVLDRAAERRGIPTIMATHGVGTAIHAGDLLTSLALTAITEIPTHSDADDVDTIVLDAVRLLAHTTRSLVSGEALQAEQARRPDTTVDAYATRCSMKTGVLFGCALAFGALFGRAPDEDVTTLFEVGTGLGVAFQIADDVLDCTGDPDVTGKPRGTDIMSGTMTLPLLLAAAHVPWISDALASADPDVDAILEWIDDSDVPATSIDHADRLLGTALSKLDSLAADYDFDRLRSLAGGAVRRLA